MHNFRFMLHFTVSTLLKAVVIILLGCILSPTLKAQTDRDPVCIEEIKTFFLEVESNFLSHSRSSEKDKLALNEIVKYLSKGLPPHSAECASEVIFRGIDISNRLPYRVALLEELERMAQAYSLKSVVDAADALFILSRATLALDRGDLNQSKLLADTALVYLDPKVDVKHVASAHVIRGYAFEGLEKYELARKDFIQAYTHYSVSSAFEEEQIGALNAAALTSQKLADYENAVTYIDLIDRKLNKEIIDENLLQDAYSIYLTLAKVKFSLGKVKEAFEAGEVAKTMALKSQDRMRISRVNMVLGELAYLNQDYEKAEYFLEDACKELNLQGDARFKAGAIQYLSKVYEQKGEYTKALKFHKEYQQIKDSLIEVNHQYAIRDVKQDAENARMMQDLIRSEANAQLLNDQKVQAKLALLLVISIVVALVSLLIALFTKYKDKAKAERALELEVLARTKELNDQQLVLQKQAEKLRQSNQELERFAYVASHDLKTPLRNISSFLGLIKRRITPESRENAKEYFDIVSDSCKQMDQLINDILEFSKIDSNVQANLVSIDLRKLLDDLTKQFAYYEKEKNASIQITGGAEILAHPTYVSQVVKNLIENGLKYNDSSFPMVKVDIKNKGNNVHIVVQDNGIGISKENHEAIFEMFKRLHGNDVYKGTGVGLAVCAKIASKMGGSIAVDSNPGIGSTFTLILPITSVEQPLGVAVVSKAHFDDSSLN